MSNDPDTKYEYDGEFYALEVAQSTDPCSFCHFNGTWKACCVMQDHCGDRGYFIPIKAEVKQPVVQLKNETAEVVAQVETPKSNLDEVRSYHVGSSDYSKYKIQPWDIWLEYDLNPWDADIVKRVLRQKQGDSREMDYEKIIHICQERLRQLKKGYK